MKRKYLYLFATLILFSCNSKSDWWEASVKEFDASNIHKIDLNDLESLNVSDNIYNIYDILKLPNDLILIEKNSEPFIKIFNEKMDSLKYAFGNIGRGPGEFEGPSGVSRICNDKECNIYIYDLFLQRVTAFTYDYKSTNITDTSIVNLKSDNAILYNYISLSDSLGLGLGFSRDHRFEFFNNDGESINNDGTVPVDNKNSPPFIRSQAYLAKPITNKDLNYFALANRYSDKIEIYNYNGKPHVLVSGPDGFDPIYEVDESHSDIRMSSDNSMKMAHISLCSSNYLYTLYSGRTRAESKISLSGDTILKFDWDGNFISGLKLPFFATAITCSGNSDLYIARENNNNYEFYKFNIE